LQNPQKSFKDTGKYLVMLKVIDTNNCMDKKEIEIVVNENFNVFIPNVFTPNLNSRNDYFFPICTGVLNIECIKIFNRWGEMLHDSQNNWDGSYLGKMVPEGVYVYEICVRDKKRSKHYYNGTVHVMR
jgi:gliding motility-associated-like protein